MAQMLEDAMRTAAERVSAALLRALTVDDPDYAVLFDSMRYSALAGGKRIRPYLVFAFCALFGGRAEDAEPLAAAVEMVHTYSLIHDDLPCMDNDDYRRGRLTNHKVYGEAGAVLAGDALLTLAFETIGASGLSDAQIAAATRCLASGAGARGMVGGQIMDIAAEQSAPDLPTLERLHDRKTGALIRAACELGCIAAGVTDGKKREDACRYAAGIGRAFQIVDDILDVYGDAALLGKSTGQDEADGKTTFLSFMSREEAYACAFRLTEDAKSALQGYSGADQLIALADLLLQRNK